MKILRRKKSKFCAQKLRILRKLILGLFQTYLCANSAQAYFMHISGLSRKLVSKIIWINGSWIDEKLREINKMKKFITVPVQLTSVNVRKA